MGHGFPRVDDFAPTGCNHQIRALGFSCAHKSLNLFVTALAVKALRFTRNALLFQAGLDG
ncbi:hypothetical protein BMS3Abin14_01648 [bacterium BMS3Abin14]|nr:hypothetical protein BMS3Abin14_01648 [bacterium BMS3Abin14]